jgi:hypothetical protein
MGGGGQKNQNVKNRHVGFHREKNPKIILLNTFFQKFEPFHTKLRFKVSKTNKKM